MFQLDAGVVYHINIDYLLDREMGGGFLSGFIRGAVVVGFLVWVWRATKKLGGKDT